MNKNYLYEYLDGTAEIIYKEYKRSALQKSGTDLGSNRELFVNNFLMKILPRRLSISNGEIIDHTGYSTGQLDTIILRDDTPCLYFGGKNTYISGGVSAVLEIKSFLDKPKLEEADKTFAHVTKLEMPSVNMVIGCLNGPFRIYRIVIAYESNSLASISKNLSSYQNIDIICVIDKGVLITKEIKENWFEDLDILKEEEGGNYSLNSKAASLGLLFLLLNDLATVTMSGSSSMENYFLNSKNKWNKE
jgi:hypothetical protein